MLSRARSKRFFLCFAERFFKQRGNASGLIFKGLKLFLRRTELVGKMNTGEDGDPCRIARCCSTGDGSNQLVDLLRDFLHLSRIAIDQQ